MMASVSVAGSAGAASAASASSPMSTSKRARFLPRGGIVPRITALMQVQRLLWICKPRAAVGDAAAGLGGQQAPLMMQSPQLVFMITSTALATKLPREIVAREKLTMHPIPNLHASNLGVFPVQTSPYSQCRALWLAAACSAWGVWAWASPGPANVSGMI